MPILDSFDDMLASAQDNGVLSRFIQGAIPSGTTAANATSGFMSWNRYPETMTFPTITSPCTGAIITHISLISTSQATVVSALEYELGSLNVGTGVFTAGVSMPSKVFSGASLQTNSGMAFAVVTTALSATTPAITITYTDQDGNTGATANMTLPTNASVNSAFAIDPYLASGDTGIRAVTGMTKSAGSSGVLKVYGIIPIASFQRAISSRMDKHNSHLYEPNPVPLIESGEKLAFYNSNNSAQQLMACIHAVGEVV